MSSSSTARGGDGPADEAADMADEPELGSLLDGEVAEDNGSLHVELDGGAEASSDEETVKGEPEQADDADDADGPPSPAQQHPPAAEPGTIAHMLELERQTAQTPVPLGNGTVADRYRELLRDHPEAGSGAGSSEDGSTMDDLPLRRAGSPVDSLLSAAEGSPSVQGSVVSSPGSSVLPSMASRPGLNSPTPSFRPFDRRFQSRISTPSMSSLRPSSPGFLSGHSRSGSLSSQLLLDAGESETPSPPWEVVRWTKLKKLTGQAFSETGRRNFGSPTCIAVSASMVLGTSKGIILMFDYNQNLKLIIGPGTKAVEAGAITSIAVSADHTTVGGGHANGSIFTWDTTRSARPFLHIPPLDHPPAPAHIGKPGTDGHVPNVAVTHLAFLGTRHTALVSADDRGMAFSHLATRGTGSLGRTVKTTRILGRYPNAPPPASGKSLKPSTVLGFASLPLGNTERSTDAMGLTAMLTPYLLVVVSTTPIAQTQHKSARPKEVAPHGAMSGCLAWFPAVKLKVPDPTTGSQMSKVKLVYCWSNILTVLDVDEVPSEDKDKPPSLRFKARSRWKCEEPIVAVQWLSRSVLTVLTITQRLIVLEDRSMRMTEAFDLIHKHIHHVDLFSAQLHSLVEQLDEDDTSMHGVVADAFYMSFKAYKGRIFLLGFADVSVGALSNWADRLIALMEHGDYVGAIQMATSYYTGDADKLTVGLPEDVELRHSMVRDKLLEIMSASLKFAFGQRAKNRAGADDAHLRELAETCFVACHGVGDAEDFLFDDMYEWYEDAGLQGIFLETLEPYVLDQSITSVPPGAVKAMVSHYVDSGWESRLEELICHMDTSTLDLDQITVLCKQHSLYDALIYVWNRALSDYITPLMDLLALLVPLTQNGNSNPADDDMHSVNALKMFPYLSYTLTGRVYPTGGRIDEDLAARAKAEIYWFLFSGKSITWPKGSKRRLLTKPAQHDEPSFPYLRLILRFDAPSFLSALNEAFEDPFLNDSPEKQANGAAKGLPEEQSFGLTVDRQYIVSILSEIMNPADFAPEDTIYLDMFIARNLPKFPQYLLLPDSMLTKVLAGLCGYPGPDLAEDAQLSAEYLLSVYHPPDLSALVPLFERAGFYRILKRAHRVDRRFGALIQAYFDDPDDRDATFAAIQDCLRPQAGLTRRQVLDVHHVLKEHARELAELDPAQAAQTLDAYAPDLHHAVLDALEEVAEHGLQYAYLAAIMEPVGGSSSSAPTTPTPSRQKERVLVEQYVRLMCRFDPAHVSDYVGVVQAAGDLRLDELLPTMEETGVVDAAVVLLAREGQVNRAMDRLLKHLNTLEAALQGVLAGATKASSGGDEEQLSGNLPDAQEAAEDILRSLQKFTHVGIWLCQGQTRIAMANNTLAARKQPRPRSKPQQKAALAESPDDDLSPEESLWLNLIDTAVQITRRVSTTLESVDHDAPGVVAAPSPPPPTLDADRLLTLLRSLVQHTFTALLTATSAPPAAVGAPIEPTPLTTTTTTSLTPPATRPSLPGRLSSSSTSTPTAHQHAKPPVSFLRVLRAFLTHAAALSPTLADLRAVLASVFAAYAYEESLLRLANRLLDASLFAGVEGAARLRTRGWRPRGSVCEACGRRVWGPGVQGGLVLRAWEERERREEAERRRKRGGGAGAGVGSGGVVGGARKAVAKDGGDARAKAKAPPPGDEEGPASGKGKGKAVGGPPSDDDDEQPGDNSARAEGVAVTGGASDESSPVDDTTATGTGSLISPVAAAAQQKKDAATALGPIVILACRHVYHQSCLDEILEQEDESGLAPRRGRGGRTADGEFLGGRQYRCPIDS